MKNSLMKSVSSLLVLLSSLRSISFCQAAGECNDDPFFQFESFEWMNEEGQMQRIIRTCAWITANNAETRRNNWCNHTTDLGVTVGNKCQDACSICSDNFPIRPPEDCKDTPLNWRDVDGNSCSFYEQDTNCSDIEGRDPITGLSHTDACCSCGGGCFDSLVGPNNDQIWFDAGGPGFGCEWYEAAPGRCEEFGSSFRNFGNVANQVCCVCGGGSSSGNGRNRNLKEVDSLVSPS